MVRSREVGSSAKALVAVSLFSGGGGLDYALCANGNVAHLVSTDSHQHFLNTTERNIRQHFPSVQHEAVLSDVREVSVEELSSNLPRRPDLVMAGPPCDDFTRFGKRRGLDGDKGPLIYEFARIVVGMQPRAFLFENVPNLASSFRDHFDRLVNTLRAAGYTTHTEVLNASAFGAATMRERVFVIGFSEPTASEQYCFPAPTHAGHGVREPNLFEADRLHPPRLVEHVLHDLPDCGYANSSITNHTARKHRPETIQHIMSVAQGSESKRSFRYRPPWNGLCRSLTAGLDSNCKAYIHPLFHREMTVREYARIHGFPDTWFFCGTPQNGLKQVANSVPIPLGRAVLRAVTDCL
jgi:DNA (cytosine-5)-methyltransferase 1